YEAPDEGRVVIDETDITAVPPSKRDFGMVFQHYAIFPHMSVGENVAFGLEARGVSKKERMERAAKALAGVGLDGASDRRVQSLSGGEQQRVALARALVIEPPVLLLDEPLSNLDPALRASTREQLRTMLHGLSVTAVFVTHDQEDAFAIADRIAMLHRGRLLQAGTPEELYHAPASAEVARFIGRAKLLSSEFETWHSGFGNSEGAHVTIGGVAQRVTVGSQPALHDAVEGLLAVLRPEALALTPADAPGVWPGTIRTRRFAGNHVAYGVELAGGVVVEVLSDDGSAREGDRIGVRLTDRPVALVPAEHT
ncbi:MAG TPA: ABC transporter ATP-binding protein, partial [Gemmatimonadaceae bacterium]|nr:ABC transporter ATP-binding protein [Gemmatimonadaceae bacterium]